MEADRRFLIVRFDLGKRDLDVDVLNRRFGEEAAMNKTDFGEDVRTMTGGNMSWDRGELAGIDWERHGDLI